MTLSYRRILDSVSRLAIVLPLGLILAGCASSLNVWNILTVTSTTVTMNFRPEELMFDS